MYIYTIYILYIYVIYRILPLPCKTWNPPAGHQARLAALAALVGSVGSATGPRGATELVPPQWCLLVHKHEDPFTSSVYLLGFPYMGEHLNHPFLFGIFNYKPSSYWSTRKPPNTWLYRGIKSQNFRENEDRPWNCGVTGYTFWIGTILVDKKVGLLLPTGIGLFYRTILGTPFFH